VLDCQETLATESAGMTQMDRIRRAAEMIGRARVVTAFTGAGISTESGLADFRSTGGLWERYRMVTFQEFLADEDARREYWRMRRELIPGLLAARPNRAHLGLAELQRLGRLQGVITQNIDGLHQAAGSDPVIELHGTNMSASCLACGRQWPIAEIQQRLEAGEAVPRCPNCHGLIKPDTVSFGQSMPADALQQAFELAEQCDLMLMIGSSLEVQPACLIPLAAAQGGAELIFVNRDSTPHDALASLCFSDPAGEVMARLAEAVADARRR